MHSYHWKESIHLEVLTSIWKLWPSTEQLFNCKRLKKTPQKIPQNQKELNSKQTQRTKTKQKTNNPPKPPTNLQNKTTQPTKKNPNQKANEYSMLLVRSETKISEKGKLQAANFLKKSANGVHVVGNQITNLKKMWAVDFSSLSPALGWGDDHNSDANWGTVQTSLPQMHCLTK